MTTWLRTIHGCSQHTTRVVSPTPSGQRVLTEGTIIKSSGVQYPWTGTVRHARPSALSAARNALPGASSRR